MAIKARKRNSHAGANTAAKVAHLTLIDTSVPLTSNSAVFEKLFTTLAGLLENHDLLLLAGDRLSGTCQVLHASGAFRSLQNDTLNAARGPLKDGLRNISFEAQIASSTLSESDDKLKKFKSGLVAVFQLQLIGEVAALLLVRNALPEAEFSAACLQSVRSAAELAKLAANATDLEAQGQTLQASSLELELRQTHKFYRQFSEAIHQCFWVAEIDSGNTIVVSDNFEKVWGASPAILRQGLTGFLNSVMPADRDRVLAEFHHKLADDFLDPVETEFRVIGYDGEVRWMWMRVFSSVMTDPGQAPRAVLIADDITEKKMAEESNRQRDADVIARARIFAVGDLASGVAHEINNPLTIIVGKAGEIKRQIAQPNFDRRLVNEYADKIQATSIRIAEIIASLKALAKHDKVVTYKRTAIEKILHELRDIVTERFRSNNVHLEMPLAPPHMYADVNSTMISQLLLNLLNNAFDAVQALPEKWVRVEFTEDDQSLFLYVTDSGAGIPIIHRGRIFDAFFTTKDPNKGTGLGLALAMGIAAHHSGSLQLDTLAPHTRFVLQIPKRQPKSAKKRA